MDQQLLSDKQQSAKMFSRWSFYLGIISLAGIMCCFPVIPVVGALGILFALISRGGKKQVSDEARLGLIFSIFGTAVSLLLTIGITVFSLVYTVDQLKTNDKFTDELREYYQQMFDNAGMDMPPEAEDMIKWFEDMQDRLKE
ncbi:MAG: hypothetical protein K6F34_10620 [Lachnospiraceae bacterium]|nr:hypothetical protein [Lachnospiraceae bacterium]